MNKRHKWHKEIKAWADGAEIEFLDEDTGRWITKMYDGWDIEAEYRIKPQPKEPQYLYVFETENGIELGKAGQITRVKTFNAKYKYIGKIKLEEV